MDENGTSTSTSTSTSGLYLWKGKYANPTHVQSAESIIQSHLGGSAYSTVLQGEEPDHFWDQINKNYPSIPHTNHPDTNSNNPPISHPLSDATDSTTSNSSSVNQTDEVVSKHLLSTIKDYTMVKQPWRLFQFSCGTGAVDVSISIYCYS